tara:strand:- start:3 stop:554 length:552 start_codon:yes stop_codon:yes gene_type:complete
MRIISGLKKSIQIKLPKGLPVSTRPTTDRVKESLFNILANRIEFSEIIVLDLFSGSGSISYEFASRGCTNIYSVDNSEKCTTFIKETSLKYGFNINVFKKDCRVFIRRCKLKFNLIFIDPPYNENVEYYNELINIIKSENILSEKGEIIIEHNPRIILSKSYSEADERKFGSSVLTFIKKASL